MLDEFERRSRMRFCDDAFGRADGARLRMEPSALRWQGALVGAARGGAEGDERRSAQVRYGVACGSLALMSVLPLATFGYW